MSTDDEKILTLLHTLDHATKHHTFHGTWHRSTSHNKLVSFIYTARRARIEVRPDSVHIWKSLGYGSWEGIEEFPTGSGTRGDEIRQACATLYDTAADYFENEITDLDQCVNDAMLSLS